MLKKIQKYLFFAGILFFSMATLFEYSWLGQTNLLSFVKGFGCGIGLVGIVKFNYLWPLKTT